MRKFGQRRALVVFFFVVLVMSLALLTRRMQGARGGYQSAYAAGNLSKTLALIDASGIVDPQSLAAKASCYRQLGEQANFSSVVQQLRDVVNAPAAADLAVALYRIQHGQLQKSPDELIELLQVAGASQADARSVVIQGMLTVGRRDEAESLLNAWQADKTDSAQAHYLTAVAHSLSGNLAATEHALLEAVQLNAQHELSWLALAELYSRPPNVRFRQAELVLANLVSEFPNNPTARQKWMRVQRRLGKPLDGFADTAQALSPEELLEFAKSEFDQGRYPTALSLLKSAQLSTTEDFFNATDRAFQLALNGQADEAGKLGYQVTWAAAAMSMEGNGDASSAVFEQAIDRIARLCRLQDIDLQLATSVDPRLEIERKSTSAPAENASVPTRAWTKSQAEPHLAGAIYLKHCAMCHGANGDGAGVASSNLYPRARNFRSEAIRFVSASNRLATDADLSHRIRTGLPGTSMPAFKQLSDEEIAELVLDIRGFQRGGLEDQYRQLFAAVALDNPAREPNPTQETNPAQETWIAGRLNPGSDLAIPALVTSPAVVEQGREVFHSVGCNQCHPLSGTTRPTVGPLFDAMGRPAIAPNLVDASLRGGDSPAELYKRIVLGIPGTPHPASDALGDLEVEALVAFLSSIAKKPVENQTNFDRSPAWQTNVADQ